MPRLRAISISGLVSELKVTSPSTSAGSMPASRRARSTASTARRSSLRPDSLENSVAPMPTMAVLPVKVCAVAAHRADPLAGRTSRQGSSSRTVPVTWSPRLLAPRRVTSTPPRPSATDLVVLGRDRPGQGHGVVGVVGGAQAGC